MNVSENGAEENNDLLIFEYLEGDLSADKALAFERQLASDPALQMKLEQWKGTVVTQDFYDTQHLEEKLLQYTGEVGKRINSIVIGVMLSFLCSLLPLSLEKGKSMPIQPIRLPSPIIAGSLKESVVETNKRALLAKAFSPIVLPAKTTQELITPVRQSRKMTELELLQPRQLVLPVISSMGTPNELEVKMKVVTIQKPLAKRMITRKQAWKTKRMKEKARQQREADQFLKGHVPYVVPLNTTNF
ncbi:MAG: hypothetical protein V4714_14875 [Bacteroidota bacterium]